MRCNTLHELLNQIAQQAKQSKRFQSVSCHDDRLHCQARDVESDAYYLIEPGEESGSVFVGLYTSDRWLSESIESDLMHLGESMDELLEEELVEMGITQSLQIHHFRDDHKFYVFRSSVKLQAPANGDVSDYLTRILLSFEACFRELGDMSGDNEN